MYCNNLNSVKNKSATLAHSTYHLLHHPLTLTSCAMENRAGNEGDNSANQEAKVAQDLGLPSGGDDPVAAAQPLTFHPSRDDNTRLRAFLQGICAQYEAQMSQRRALHSRQHNDEDQAVRAGMTDQQQRASEISEKPVANKKPGGETGIPSRKKAAPPIAGAKKEPPKPQKQPAKAPGRKRKSPPSARKPASPDLKKGSRSALDEMSRACIQRARARSSIDINAPDPEQDSPPGETEEEKRRRKERINGRRKRTKKLIELEQLNHQVVDLSESNQKLRNENGAFREQLKLVKKILAEGGTPTAEQFCLPTMKSESGDSNAEEAKQQSGIDAVIDRPLVPTRPTVLPGSHPAFSNVRGNPSQEIAASAPLDTSLLRSSQSSSLFLPQQQNISSISSVRDISGPLARQMMLPDWSSQVQSSLSPLQLTSTRRLLQQPPIHQGTLGSLPQLQQIQQPSQLQPDTLPPVGSAFIQGTGDAFSLLQRNQMLSRLLADQQPQQQEVPWNHLQRLQQQQNQQQRMQQQQYQQQLLQQLQEEQQQQGSHKHSREERQRD